MDTKTMIAYLQIYIHIRKNVQIEISIRNHFDFLLLQRAYQHAAEWMQSNNVKLTIL